MSVVESKSAIRLGFFELLFGKNEGYLCIASTDPVAPQTSFRQRFFDWPRESVKVENYILKEETDRNVYFCINLLAQQERKKKHCRPTNLVWADLDNVNPSELTKLPPPIVVQSSPGRWQAFWRLTSKVEPFDAERYSKRIAYSTGADLSGWDLTQLFRVPLSKNWKHRPAALVILERALELKTEPELFEKAIPAPPEEAPLAEVPDSDTLIQEPEVIIEKYRLRLDMDRVVSLFTYEPEDDQDWSKLLWSLEMQLFRAGMTAEEVFVVCRESAVNKYARDGRPVEHLWREVLKASEVHGIGTPTPDKELLEMPQFVSEPATETFIDAYKDWACEATDAISEFHELSSMITLSVITAGSLRLQTSYGEIAPNLWGLVLGDSTVTRKSTSMKMAVDLLTTLEPELILATDGSVEGLLTGLANRPNKVSVFFRDEVSGLFDSINRRDYLSSMPETLAHLYDVPPVFSRLLRKETIRIESPAFIFFGGGITERVYQNVSEDWIESGFMPRFLIVSGEFDKDSMRSTGPPTEPGLKKRIKIAATMGDLFEQYATEVATKFAGETMYMPPRVLAELDDKAWKRYQAIEAEMTIQGYESLIRNVALPTFDRMSRSILKMSMILAATRQEPHNSRIKVSEDDVINAAWYAQRWGRHSIQLILNAGKAPREKVLDRVRRKIGDNPGILRSKLMQHLKLNKREADEVISTLEERGEINKQKEGNGWRYWTI